MPKRKGSSHSKKITRVKPQKLVKVFQKIGFEISCNSRKHIVMRKQGHVMNLAIPNHPGDEGVCVGVILDLIKKAGITRSKYLDLLRNV